MSVPWRKIALYSCPVFYLVAGVNHFINPGFYKSIMPPWLPAHDPLILVSGIAEVTLGLLLLPRQTRRAAAWGIIILLILIFPANIQMMITYRQEQHPHVWIAILRLPMQVLLIVWAYRYTKKMPAVVAGK